MAYHMTPALADCLRLCAEFASRAKDLERARNDVSDPGTHPKEHSALRRTSMELTRALAEYRRIGALDWDGKS